MTVSLNKASQCGKILLAAFYLLLAWSAHWTHQAPVETQTNLLKQEGRTEICWSSLNKPSSWSLAVWRKSPGSGCLPASSWVLPWPMSSPTMPVYTQPRQIPFPGAKGGSWLPLADPIKLAPLMHESLQMQQSLEGQIWLAARCYLMVIWQSLYAASTANDFSGVVNLGVTARN